jgi:hypothetical protein
MVTLGCDFHPEGSPICYIQPESRASTIHYRGQRLGFRELPPASTRVSEEKGAAPSSAPPSPNPTRWHAWTPPPEHPWRRSYQQMQTPRFSAAR